MAHQQILTPFSHYGTMTLPITLTSPAYGSGSGYLVSLASYVVAWQFDPRSINRYAKLPDATKEEVGWFHIIRNQNASRALSVENNAGVKIATIEQDAVANNCQYLFTLMDNSTAAGVWAVTNIGKWEKGDA